MSIAPRTLFVFAALCSSVAAQKVVDTRDLAIDDGAWHALPVTGGRAALAALGVSDARERAAVMIELIRRLHFSPKPPAALEAALLALSEANTAPNAPPTDAVLLPLPLSPATWSTVVFERDVPLRRLFVEILRDPAARLLYHGLAGLDADTRRWIGSQPDVVRGLYRNRDALRSFALFAPALRVVDGKVVVPGGAVAEQRWTSSLDAAISRPDHFVRRLFEHNSGRTAGLYFTIAVVDEPRRRFLLSAVDSLEAGNRAFNRLVSSFGSCPAHSTAFYPFALRSYDPALLLLELNVTAAGAPAGPTARRFWQRVLDGDDRLDAPLGAALPLTDDWPIDAAWMVDVLCAASSEDRGSIFVTLLAGHRVFAGISDTDLGDALLALRARRLYSAVFMALEHAGVRRSRTYAAVARHAAQLARLDNPERGVTALRQFQGALALTLNAVSSTTLTVQDAEELLEALAVVPFENERYDGRLIEWFEQRWLPAVRRSIPSNLEAQTVEDAIAHALAGPAATPPRPVHWEGLDYVVDFAGATRQRLREVRRRQGALTVDSVLELRRIATALQQPDSSVGQVGALKIELESLAPRFRGMKVADEFAGEGPNVGDQLSEVVRRLETVDSSRRLARARAAAGLTRAIDFLFSHVLASWAYALHVGGADSASMIGGDGSLRHDLGVGTSGRNKFKQRWEIATGNRGAIAGSLLGLHAALGTRLLRRLSSASVPPPPTIDGNDLASFVLTAALSDPRRLTDDDLERIAKASADGLAAIDRARADPQKLVAAASAAAMSPWRREALAWIAREEPDRLVEQFSMTERIRLGGLAADDARAWGTVSIVTGCLCLQMPPARIPEVSIGRPADGIVGGQSADLMLRVATILAELKMPASLASPVLHYAMRAFLDEVKPLHTADFDAFVRQARALDRRTVEDYLGAIAAVGALRPIAIRP